MKIATLIKICGIQDAKIALATAQAGAHFIGLIFHPHSRRCVSGSAALEIVNAIRHEQTTPVAVFVNHSSKEMRELT